MRARACARVYVHARNRVSWASPDGGRWKREQEKRNAELETARLRPNKASQLPDGKPRRNAFAGCNLLPTRAQLASPARQTPEQYRHDGRMTRSNPVKKKTGILRTRENEN